MRIREVYDEKDIREKLSTFFTFSGDVSIHNGKVEIGGNLRLKRKAAELPIIFDSVNGSVNFSGKGLISLEGSPSKIRKYFDCSRNKITSLKGCPQQLYGGFNCEGNKLTNLIGAPPHVETSFDCHNNPLTSLDGLPHSIDGWIRIPYSKDLPLLKLLFIKNLIGIDIWGIELNAFPISNTIVIYSNLQDIMRKYIGQGRKGAIQCAAELTRAGFKGNARM